MKLFHSPTSPFVHKVMVLIRETETRFRLEAWRSFAPHLEALFALARRELALGI